MAVREIFEVFLVGQDEPVRFVDTQSSDFVETGSGVIRVMTSGEGTEQEMYCFPFNNVLFTRTSLIED